MRQQAAELHIDIRDRRTLGIDRDKHVRILILRDAERFVARARQALRLAGIVELTRRLADRGAIGGTGDLKLIRRRFAGGLGGRECRLGLGHVRARHLAHREPIVCGLEVARQHLLVIDVEPEDRLSQHDIVVRDGRRMQGGLLDDVELRALDEHVEIGDARLRLGLPAGIEVLGDGQRSFARPLGRRHIRPAG